MFTGIITDQGRIRSLDGAGDIRAVIETSYDVDMIDIGASIACDGVCLTVTAKGHEGADKIEKNQWFAVDISNETLACSACKNWTVGGTINLERALKVGDELGGHIVTGHVDGLAKILDLTPDDHSTRVTLALPDGLAPFVAAKGSVTLNGVSLTVNTVDGAQFSVNLIPHTQAVTTLGELKVGDEMNVEIDVLARYVARLKEVA